MFQLRRRTEMPKKKKKRSSGSNRPEHGLAPEQRPPGPDRLPFLIELNPGTKKVLYISSVLPRPFLQGPAPWLLLISWNDALPFWPIFF